MNNIECIECQPYPDFQAACSQPQWPGDRHTPPRLAIILLVITLLSTHILSGTGYAAIVTFNFTGEVTGVTNPTNPGVWGGIDLSNPQTLQLSGQFSYDQNQQGGYFPNGDFYYWTNGGGGGALLPDTGFLFSQTLNFEGFVYSDTGGANYFRQAIQWSRPDDAYFLIGSIIPDAPTSALGEQLNLNLPANYSAFELSLFLSFENATNSTSTLPSGFNFSPNSFTEGLMGVQVLDPNGNPAGASYGMTFSITSITAVPEPSFGMLLGILGCTLATMRRRRWPR